MERGKIDKREEKGAGDGGVSNVLLDSSLSRALSRDSKNIISKYCSSRVPIMLHGGNGVENLPYVLLDSGTKRSSTRRISFKKKHFSTSSKSNIE